jgi:pimeloyl-ACP methyl ester carboxylesterase
MTRVTWYLRRLEGSLPDEEVRASVGAASQALAAPRRGSSIPPLRFRGGSPASRRPSSSRCLRRSPPPFVSDSLRTRLIVIAEADQRDLLSRIAVPTLLIWGELDARSPLSVARQFEQAIPHTYTKLVVIPGAGHVSNLEQPEQFNEAVRELCRAHPPALALKPAAPSLGGAGLKSPWQRACGPLDRRLRSLTPAARLT